MPDRPELHNVAIEAERSTLGGILLLGAEPWPAEVERLSVEDFFKPEHAEVFSAILALQDAREPIDELTALGRLGRHAPKGGWAAWLSELTDQTPTAANLGHYARLVLQERRRRDYLIVTRRAIDLASEPGADADAIAIDAALQLGKIADGRQLASMVRLRDAVSVELVDLEERSRGGQRIGEPTGFADIDRLLCGMCPGELIVVAGRPSMGKSSLSRAILLNLGARGVGGALFSLEMDRGSLARASMSTGSGVELQRIRNGSLRDADWPKLTASCAELHKYPVWICDTGDMHVRDMRIAAKSLASRHPLGLIVADYLQLARGDGHNREQEIASITRGLKALAKELGVPVMALSQLNRSLESRSDKRPMLSDLRESGAIEQDADVVMLLYRDEYYNRATQHPGECEVNIAKARNGPTGMVRLRWFSQVTKFVSYEG